jgi:hypothetical protein
MERRARNLPSGDRGYEPGGATPVKSAEQVRVRRGTRAPLPSGGLCARGTHNTSAVPSWNVWVCATGCHDVAALRGNLAA